LSILDEEFLGRDDIIAILRLGADVEKSESPDLTETKNNTQGKLCLVRGALPVESRA
jgi:hypothetical protein